MKKVLSVVLVVGLCLLLVGGGLFVGALAAAGWDIKAFSNIKIEEKRFEESADEKIESLEIDFENAKIELLFSADCEFVAVDYPQIQNGKGKNASEIALSQTDGHLTISEKISWQGRFALWNFSEPKVTVTLPADGGYAVVLSTDNGNITVNGTGRLASLKMETDNGNISTTDAELVCEGDMQAETDNGNVQLGTLTAQTVTAATDVGNIETEGILTAARIDLSSEVGNVEAHLAGKREDYAIEIECGLGKANLDPRTGGEKLLRAETSIGNIEITFSEE